MSERSKDTPGSSPVSSEDPDDAPELTNAWFDRADMHFGGRLVRRGRPPSVGGRAKTQITLRIDADVIEAFKATGAGWQSEINAALRAAVIGQRSGLAAKPPDGSSSAGGKVSRKASAATARRTR